MLYLSDAMPLLPPLPPIKWYTTPLTTTIHQNEGKRRGKGREESLMKERGNVRVVHTCR